MAENSASYLAVDAGRRERIACYARQHSPVLRFRQGVAIAWSPPTYWLPWWCRPRMMVRPSISRTAPPAIKAPFDTVAATTGSTAPTVAPPRIRLNTRDPQGTCG